MDSEGLQGYDVKAIPIFHGFNQTCGLNLYVVIDTCCRVFCKLMHQLRLILEGLQKYDNMANPLYQDYNLVCVLVLHALSDTLAAGCSVYSTCQPQ